MNTPSDNPRMPVASLPSSPAPTSPTSALPRNTTLWYRLRVTAWLKRMLFVAYVKRHPLMFAWQVFVAVVIYSGTIAFAVSAHNTFGSGGLRIGISCLSWASLVFCCYVIPSPLGGQAIIDFSHLITFPVSRSHALWLLYWDTWYSVAIVTTPTFLVVLLLSALLGLYLLAFLSIVYLFSIALFVLVLELVLTMPSTSKLGTWLNLLLFFSSGWGVGIIILYQYYAEHTAPAMQPLYIIFLGNMYKLVAPLMHYMLPGAATELFVQAQNQPDLVFLFWAFIFCLNVLLLIMLARQLFLDYEAHIMPLRSLNDVIANRYKNLEQPANQYQAAPDLFWVRWLRDRQMRQLLEIRGILNISRTRLAKTAVFLLCLLVIATLLIKAQPAATQDIVFAAFLIVTAALSMLIGAFALASEMTEPALLSPLNRGKLLSRLASLVIWRFGLAFFLVLFILSTTPLYITLVYGVLCFCVVLMNIANGYVAVVLSGHRSESAYELRNRYTRTNIGVSLLVVGLLIVLQLPLLPIDIILFSTIAAEVPVFNCPSTSFFLGCVVYAVLYFYFGSKFAAWLLTKRELWYIEKALYRRG